jgi:hypothetical protein
MFIDKDETKCLISTLPLRQHIAKRLNKGKKNTENSSKLKCQKMTKIHQGTEFPKELLKSPEN